MIRGLAGGDTITGYAGSDDLEGNDGPDTLYGGNPELYQAAGNDVVDGGVGYDDVFGGSGADTLIGGPDNDGITDGPEGDAAADRLQGGYGDDDLTAANAPASKDEVFCGDGRDTVIADGLDEVAPDCEDASRLPEGEEGLAEDAPAYAAEVGVTTEEALRRLQLQEDVSDLAIALEANEAATYGDLEIRHEPEFSVEVNLTQGGMETAMPYVQGTPLEAVTRVGPVDDTLAELEAAQEQAISYYEAQGVPFEAGINVPLNRAEVYLPPTTRAQLGDKTAPSGQLPADVEAIPVDELSEPMAVFYGGLPFNNPTCTSGFTVRAANGDEGTVTAGHCKNPDDVTYRGRTFPMPDSGQSIKYNYDVQFNRTPGRDDRALFLDRDYHGAAYRGVRYVRGRDSVQWGKLVCKSGRTSGYTCGRIADKSIRPGYVAQARGTFIRVHRSGGGNMVSPGDSGGPVFIGYTALGLVSGGGKHSGHLDLIYMASNYINSAPIAVDKVQTR